VKKITKMKILSKLGNMKNIATTRKCYQNQKHVEILNSRKTILKNTTNIKHKIKHPNHEKKYESKHYHNAKI